MQGFVISESVAKEIEKRSGRKVTKKAECMAMSNAIGIVDGGVRRRRLEHTKNMNFTQTDPYLC